MIINVKTTKTDYNNRNIYLSKKKLNLVKKKGKKKIKNEPNKNHFLVILKRFLLPACNYRYS